MENEITLTPAQQRAADGLLAGLPLADVLALRCDSGRGRTTVLETVRAAGGGVCLGAQDFMGVLKTRQPAAIEEAFLEMIEQALQNHDAVFVDDLHLIVSVVDSFDYPRTFLLDAALTALFGAAGARKKKLVFGMDARNAPWPIRRRAWYWEIAEFQPEDYARFCRSYLDPQTADRLDYTAIHRFAPALTLHQLQRACVWLAREAALDTDRFLDYLRSQDLASNVDIAEVPKVDWNDLKGVEEVLRVLEAKIALPLENDALASELHLKPKRGVLLAGPPGTGKTTIGRALAHRLKSKFFLIDGTVVAGTSDFYAEVGQVFDAAKQNAPSVIFIDDADVIFEGGEDRGFYRYLLTMLDGLKSVSAQRVCVMMTAMNVGSLPAAMLRSGRVELWLEMRLPDEPARAAILREKLSALPHPIGGADVPTLASASRGLTGADLKAVIEDGKLAYAHDKVRGEPTRPAEDYFLEAIDAVRANRRNYARSKPGRLTEEIKLGFIVE